jgi:outer membrane protein assembly factor BamB
LLYEIFLRVIALLLVKRKLLLVAPVAVSLAVFVAAQTSPRQATFAWRFATGGQIRSRPAVAADGTVYAIAEDGYLYALSRAGALSWKTDLGWLPWDCLAVSPDGMIYAGLKNKDFIAVTPSGIVAWRLHFDGLFVGDPLIAPDGTVYLGVGQGTLASLSESGRQQWSITLPGSLLLAPVMDGSGTIYLAASDRRLYALTQWGEFKWSLPLHAEVTTIAIGRDGTVLAGTKEGQIFAINPNGDMVWSCKVSASVAGVSVGLEQIVATLVDGQLLGLSAVGNELWRENTSVGLDSPPLIRGSALVAFGQDGSLLMLHQPVGVVERFSVGTAGAAVLAHDGSIYLGGRDWVLYAFPRPAQAEGVTGPWPQAGHDEQHSGRTPYGPAGGMEASLNANPDYLYLESLGGSGSHDQALAFLSEVGSRIRGGSLGKSTWYVVRILEKLAGTGLIDPVYRYQKVINNFSDVRADAATLLGEVGSAGSRWVLIHVMAAEIDAYALSEEIKALGVLAFDGDGSSSRAIAVAFARAGTLPADNRLAAAAVDALDRIATINGILNQPAVETLFSIYRGPYFEQIRRAALTALQKERNPASASP